MGSMPLPESCQDPQFTDHVISSMGPRTTPRMREVMTSLIKHVHDFARETNLTLEEWFAGMEVLNEAGKLTDDRINHMQLLSDVIGLESLVDELTHKVAADTKHSSTTTAVYGPFYREDAPLRENGSSIIVNSTKDDQVTYMHGRVTDCTTGKPLSDAVVNIWQSSTNGLYDQQDPEQMTGNLRGRFKTDTDGYYGFYCLRPTPYPVPGGFPASKLLDLMDRNHYRPAHIHIVVTHQGFSPLCTQVYPLDDPYLRDDAVFAVVDSLVREFKPRKGDPKAKLELEFDVKMVPGGEGKWNGVSMNGGGRIGAGAGMDGNGSNGAALERMG